MHSNRSHSAPRGSGRGPQPCARGRGVAVRTRTRTWSACARATSRIDVGSAFDEREARSVDARCLPSARVAVDRDRDSGGQIRPSHTEGFAEAGPVRSADATHKRTAVAVSRRDTPEAHCGGGVGVDGCQGRAPARASTPSCSSGTTAVLDASTRRQGICHPVPWLCRCGDGRQLGAMLKRHHST